MAQVWSGGDECHVRVREFREASGTEWHVLEVHRGTHKVVEGHWEAGRCW